MKEERERASALSRFDCLRRDCGRSNYLSSYPPQVLFIVRWAFALRSGGRGFSLSGLPRASTASAGDCGKNVSSSGALRALHPALGAQSVNSAGQAVRGEDRGEERGGERRDFCNKGGQSGGNEVESHRRRSAESCSQQEDFSENRSPFPAGAERQQTPRGQTGGTGDAVCCARSWA